MADYSYNEIMKMQNDAIRRVNEMQQKAKSVVREVNEKSVTEKKPQTDHNADTLKRVKMPNDYLKELKNFASSSYFEGEEAKSEINEEKTESFENTNNLKLKKEDNIIKNIFGDFDLDSDKALILSLILLLTEEKADEMLILSLLYILS